MKVVWVSCVPPNWALTPILRAIAHSLKPISMAPAVLHDKLASSPYSESADSSLFWWLSCCAVILGALFMRMALWAIKLIS